MFDHRKSGVYSYWRGARRRAPVCQKSQVGLCAQVAWARASSSCPYCLLRELLGAGKQLHHAFLQQLVVAPPQQEGLVNLVRAFPQDVLRRQARLQRRQKPVLPIGKVNQVLLEVLELGPVELRKPGRHMRR